MFSAFLAFAGQLAPTSPTGQGFNFEFIAEIEHIPCVRAHRHRRCGHPAYVDLRGIAERYECALLEQLEPEEVVLLRCAVVKLGSAAPPDFT